MPSCQKVPKSPFGNLTTHIAITPGQVAIDENVQRILVSAATPGTKMFVHMSSSMLIQEIRKNGIPDFWLDTKKMQEAYSLEIKGWTKKVEWKQSTIPGK